MVERTSLEQLTRLRDGPARRVAQGTSPEQLTRLASHRQYMHRIENAWLAFISRRMGRLR
jgi:hypothetical protein